MGKPYGIGGALARGVRVAREVSFERAAVGALLLCVVVLFAAGFSRLRLTHAPGADEWRVASIELAGTEELVDAFARLGYRLDGVRSGEFDVPRLFLASLPPGLAELSPRDDRKRVFLKLALPLVLRMNETLARERERIVRLGDTVRRGESLAQADRRWLSRMAAAYRLPRPDVDALLLRVDVIPPSLALAQAAEESGWGTSRFAREGNALFGEWTFRTREGILPSRRENGAEHYVRAFDGLPGAVRAYASNLNTHPAYREFRRRRAELRREGGAVDGYALAGSLVGYAERGEGYVASLRRIIRENGLEAFDGARLTADARGSGAGA